MAKSEDRYILKMEFKIVKEGEEDKKPWILANTYEGLDYGQLVTAQAVAVDTLSKGLMSIGIAQAGQLGFDVMAALNAIKHVANPTEVPKARPGR